MDTVSAAMSWLGNHRRYSIQIYFDSQVYSDMAFGLENNGFNFPGKTLRTQYTSKQHLLEFWRRTWHITL